MYIRSRAPSRVPIVKVGVRSAIYVFSVFAIFANVISVAKNESLPAKITQTTFHVTYQVFVNFFGGLNKSAHICVIKCMFCKNWLRVFECNLLLVKALYPVRVKSSCSHAVGNVNIDFI